MSMDTDIDIKSLQTLSCQTFQNQYSSESNSVQYHRNSTASSYENCYYPCKLYQPYIHGYHGWSPNTPERKRKTDYGERSPNTPERKRNKTYDRRISSTLEGKREQVYGYPVSSGQQRCRTSIQEQFQGFDHNQTAPFVRQHMYGSYGFAPARTDNHLSLTYPCPNFQLGNGFPGFQNPHSVNVITPNRVDSSIKSTNSSYYNLMTDFDRSQTFEIFSPKATSTPYTSPEPEVQNLNDAKDLSNRENPFVVPETKARAPRRTKKFRCFLSEDEEAVYYLITKYLANETE